MVESPAGAAPVCYRHPSRETYVRCARCDRPICPECMNEAAVGHQCPECVADGRRSQRAARTAFGGSPSGRDGLVTRWLIIINVAVFILGALTAGKGFNLLIGSSPLHQYGAVLGEAPYAPGGQVHGVATGEYWRLVTAMFLHFGVVHLGANMWALWQLGRPLEAFLGRSRFLALYVVSGIGGNVAAYAFSAPNKLTAGASTALFGLFGAFIFVLRKLKLSLSAIIPVIAINLFITFSLASFISVSGHLGGLVTGAAIGAGMAYAPPKARTQTQVAVIAGVLLALVVLTVYRTATLGVPVAIPG